MTLPQIDGLDTAAGLRFFGGRNDVYLHALRTFAALYGAGLPLAGAAAEPAARPDALQLKQAAHSLAGASLVLGATALGTQAQRLEALLARGCRPVADELANLQRALAALVQQLQTRLPAG